MKINASTPINDDMLKKRPGRKRLFRDSKLFVRIKPVHDAYLDKICEEADMTRSEWVDLHIGFLKSTMKPKRASLLVQKS